VMIKDIGSCDSWVSLILCLSNGRPTVKAFTVKEKVASTSRATIMNFMCFNILLCLSLFHLAFIPSDNDKNRLVEPLICTVLPAGRKPAQLP
jgi:hypothetical protein